MIFKENDARELSLIALPTLKASLSENGNSFIKWKKLFSFHSRSYFYSHTDDTVFFGRDFSSENGFIKIFASKLKLIRFQIAKLLFLCVRIKKKSPLFSTDNITDPFLVKNSFSFINVVSFACINKDDEINEGSWHGIIFQEALAQLRGVSSGGSRTGESYETLQSRARELEKKVCVFTISTFPYVFFSFLTTPTKTKVSYLLILCFDYISLCFLSCYHILSFEFYASKRITRKK